MTIPMPYILMLLNFAMESTPLQLESFRGHIDESISDGQGGRGRRGGCVEYVQGVIRGFNTEIIQEFSITPQSLGSNAGPTGHDVVHAQLGNKFPQSFQEQPLGKYTHHLGHSVPPMPQEKTVRAPEGEGFPRIPEVEIRPSVTLAFETEYGTGAALYSSFDHAGKMHS
jgi:hypothetical protein